ncbi:VOC family protein [Aerococcaceae bacterium INB8]|uniref:VOC family protein n=1 Tax=Ruoffia halotolerans TaxID=2748684 RepID=A0A839A5U6_9LACT|nr:VOC family protein [Ruoffia halotolerans]MBA5729073.1 VOC family protein [Ruoffia halotolerans]
MKIEHIGMWVKDIEETRRFYETYFDVTANNLYRNEKKGFESYFLTFASGARLEIMHCDDITEAAGELFGYAHLAISVGDKDDVDQFTKRLTDDGYYLLDGPRTTGDGYYEAVVLDPDGNRIELTTD